MIVKIKKSNLDTYWYTNKVGEVFQVHPYLDEDKSFRTVDNLHFIDFEDCIIVTVSKNELQALLTSLGGEVAPNAFT